MDNNTTPEPNVVHDPELAGMAIAMGAYAVMENCHGNSAGCYTPEALCVAVDHLLSALIAGAEHSKRPDILDRVRTIIAEAQTHLDEPASIFAQTK